MNTCHGFFIRSINSNPIAHCTALTATFGLKKYGTIPEPDSPSTCPLIHLIPGFAPQADVPPR